MEREPLLIESPDSPYTVRVAWTAKAMIVDVSADVLVGDGLGSDEVRAECRRLALAYTDQMRDTLMPRPEYLSITAA